MTDIKNGSTKIWVIVIPCLIAAVTFGYSIGLTIGTYAHAPFITPGAEVQIKLLSAQFDQLQMELKSFRTTLDAQSVLLTTVATKFDAHVTVKP
jgi:hypothetical protein